MIEWLSWLPNNSGFINYNVLDTLTDTCSTPPSLKILQQRVHELVGGALTSPPPPPPLYNVVGNKRFKSGRVEFSNVEGVDNF